MRNFFFGLTAALLVLPMSAVGYFALGLGALQSDARPPVWESKLMRTSVYSSVRRRASRIQAPTTANDESLVEGGRLYLNACAGCHGGTGKPHDDLSHYPPVPQFAKVGTQYSEPEIYWIIKHGIRMTAMSAYGPFYSEKQLWALASFLSRMQRLPTGVLERIQAEKADAGQSK